MAQIPDPDDAPDHDYALVLAVLATADAFLRESQRLFRPLGLTAAQFNVLNILAGHADGLSQRALGDKLLVDRSNVTGLLDRMTTAGWVRRADHPEDRRVYLITLTPAGRKLWAKAAAVYRDVIAQVTDGLSVRDQRDTAAILGRLEKAAARWQLPETKGTKP
ncbi:MAG: hypothetical protein RLZZ15_1103 [Verrucomicrobiota bacterium]|jgi:DNA-binding MarR family transcriptional regulator